MSNIGTKFILAERFTFDPLSNSLIDKENSEEIIRLGSNESRILWLLAQHPNEVVSRNDLHDFVWREQGFEVDDSSLTQAISTLRKLLKDSTKSPQYVKTVPKRGYQLITRVDTVEEEIQRSIEVDESAQQNNNIDVAETLNLMPAISSPHAQSATQTAINKPTHDWGARLIFLVAMIIPLAVLLLTNPSQSKFKPLIVVDDVAVNMPINHPDLSKWLPSIELCVKKYNEKHIGGRKPKEVIATGGQNNQLTLNYIHSPEVSGENITLRIVANPKDAIKVCE
ncbi:transcriptional regulator [Vibrio metoecus]|uniref:Transcriptional regulator n=1 Tax=Vibrio metoecus TaxID=1481663 RepID=A0A0N8UH03_VIBMT|nr:transcriptional regulator [Vibrio metoecus]KQA21434.1 transcriptional regulator [Vibrio metoecus]KQB01996.1 transcriptional regulator [Vibrio metoecus]MCR9385598.1 winged helix-turn-helix domain-containing protein [Vibrio metoecus]PAR31936.1 transcriptional regulator [Vibrio metoecus]PAR46768.1 transcriptional regulator [Vibrio metoecus]